MLPLDRGPALAFDGVGGHLNGRSLSRYPSARALAASVCDVGYIDWTVIRSSALAGLMIVVPSALIAQFLRSTAVGDLAWVFLVIVLIGFVVAGFGAGFLRSDTPMKHGAISAICAYAMIQIFGAAWRIARGESINPVTYPLLALMAGSFGLVGGLFGDWHRRRTRRS